MQFWHCHRRSCFPSFLWTPKPPQIGLHPVVQQTVMHSWGFLDESQSYSCYRTLGAGISQLRIDGLWPSSDSGTTKREVGWKDWGKNKGKRQNIFFILHVDSCHRAAWSSETDSSVNHLLQVQAAVFLCDCAHVRVRKTTISGTVCIHVRVFMFGIIEL